MQAIDPVSAESSAWCACGHLFVIVSSHGGEGATNILCLLRGEPVSFLRAPPSGPSLPRGPLLLKALGISVQCENGWGQQLVHHNTKGKYCEMPTLRL